MPTHYEGTAEETAALDTYIKLSRAAETVSQAVNAHLADHGLTISQFGVLESLYHLGPMPVGRVGEKILKSSGNMTLVIDNLEKRGLVERVRGAADRRQISVRLTDDGRALVASIMPDHARGVVESFACLSRDEQATLAALCRKLGLALATSRTHNLQENHT